MRDELCLSLNALAAETWAHMDYGFHGGYGRPDERAFTDHHMIELERRHGSEIRAVKFSQNREAETAADFEWYIGDGDTYLQLRVQAKKLDLDRCRYPGLQAQIGKTGQRQIDRLIEAAAEDEFFAIYLFFNGPCQMLMADDRCENDALAMELRGCSVARADEVRAQLDHEGADYAAMAEVSRPWQCLTCCPLVDDPHPGRRAMTVLGSGVEPRRLPQPQPTNQLPAYARAVIAAPPGEARFVDWQGPGLPGARAVLTLTTARQQAQAEPGDLE